MLDTKEHVKKALCDKHGDYESKGMPSFTDPGKIMFWSKCPVCSEIAEQERLEKEAEQKRIDELERFQSRLSHAGVPKKFRKKTFTDYQTYCKAQEAAKRTCMQFAANFDKALESGTSLLLCGNAGSGKNHLAMAIVNEVMKQKYLAHYVTVYEMISEIKSCWGKGENAENVKTKSFGIPHLLVIDEIGQQFNSETERLLLSNVINHRYADEKPTIFISNLKFDRDEKDPKDTYTVKSALGSRIISRLREGGGRVIVFNWPDHRPRIKDSGVFVD